MPFIHLTTFIEAPQQRVFDLSRSLDLHRDSMDRHEEKIVAGVQGGLINLDEIVTWQAKHFFKKRILQVKITKMNRPDSFTDEQLTGDFKMMKHEHFFKPVQNGTIMIDQFHFETPYGPAGKLINFLYLTKYMTALLSSRNELIKKAAETDLWKQYLNK